VGLFRDLRYALRALRQSPGFTLTAIAVLALGIGANTAIFSVVYAVILRPLPYPDASRLVFVWQRFPVCWRPSASACFVARQNYREWQRQNTVFQEMGAFHTASLDESSGGSSQKASTHFVSANLFHLFGTQPRFGRLFREDEERAGPQPRGHSQQFVLLAPLSPRSEGAGQDGNVGWNGLHRNRRAAVGLLYAAYALRRLAAGCGRAVGEPFAFLYSLRLEGFHTINSE
jgi:hypothetical protein